MFRSSLLGRIITLFAAFSLAFPFTTLAQSPVSVSIKDITLSGSGEFRGQIVDSQGVGCSHQNVLLQHATSKRVNQAVTNQDGWFTVTGLKGGVFQLVSGGTQQLIRLWPANVAPPQSQDQILVFSQSDQIFNIKK